ncbi:hypothetical protein AAE478_002982 [Parahypoxylon ruwenzoriense]
MDDTTTLVSDLLQKLTELDNKVNEYRHDMAAQFHRYSHQRLQDLPGDISTKIKNLVAEQYHNYPALNPSLDRAIVPKPQGDTLAVRSDEKAWPSKLSSPPASPQTPVAPLDDGLRSPHEREREFHGLFTPSYLPLLDAVQRPSFTPALPSFPASETKDPNSNQDIARDALVNVMLSRPDPVRRHTGDTVSSAASDDSATRIRRSALRRSSSSSTKTQSPRRVRFDVEGEEVFPTSSPPISPRAPEFPPSPVGNPTTLLDESYDATMTHDGETNLLGSSPPMPKKITSTDRLKAMARNSNEDTSNWEVVGNLEATDDDDDDEEEDELVMAGLRGRKANDTSRPAANHVNSENTAHHIDDVRLPTKLGAPLPAVKEIEENEAAEGIDDTDDVLTMPPLSSFKGKKRFSPPLPTTLESEATATGAQELMRKRTQPTEPLNPVSGPLLDEETMFQFDSNHDAALGEGDKNKKYIDEEDEEDDKEADATPVAENTVLYSTSPAIPVVKAAPPPPASPSSHQIAPSAGSYRGKPFSIGVVRDPELYRKAAEMGDFYTFVGSVDGRSGVDETSSYRPEVTYFNGTPRSLSERLMREDMDETRRNTEANEHN